MQFKEIYTMHVKFEVVLILKNRNIKKKYLSINFPYSFIQSAFNSCQQKCKSLIPKWLF